MQQIIVIGTLHENLTPVQELIELFEQYKPAQILVEMTDADVQSGTILLYPPEMQATYQWAKQNKLAIRGFDVDIDILRPGVSKKDETKVVEAFKQAITGLSWKDLNKKQYRNIGRDDLGTLIDPRKDRRREEKMLKNIQKLAAPTGVILLVTGCGHLDFLENNLAGAKFALG